MLEFAEVLERLMDFKNLDEEDAFRLMEMMMNGELQEIQIAALLTALAMKGETVSEITGFARAMRNASSPVKVPKGMEVVDTCGTGGDRFNSFNISTAAAIIAASAGVPVAKHGNRAVTGSCGGADILEAAGVVIDLGPEAIEKSLESLGMAFMFAPLFHRAMANVKNVRRALGIRTVFNILGPLTSPAAATIQLVGVFDPYLVGPVAEVLKNLGVKRAMVVHGFDSHSNPTMDEISTVGPTLVARLEEGKITVDKLGPDDFGVKRGNLEHLKAGETVEDNLKIFLEVIGGVKKTDAQRSRLDIALANAGAIIYLSGKAETLKEGTELARASVESGSALKLLKEFAIFTENVKD